MSIRVPQPARVLLAACVLTTILIVGLLIDDAHAQSATPAAPPAATTTAPPAATTTAPPAASPTTTAATSPTTTKPPTATPTPRPPPPPPAPVKASDVLKSAAQYVGVPYVWGGFSPSGFDCSGYVSRIWSITRHTTDTMDEVVKPITKGELLPGDALNYPLAGQIGHIRIFDKWATADKGLVWIYEATEPEVMHRVVPYDPRYIPVRRLNIISDVPMPPPPPLPADWNKPPKRAAPAAAPATTTAPAASTPTATPVPTPPGYIAGRITDEKSGQPVASARVFYWTQKDQYSVSSVVTDKDGRFTTPKVDAGTYELAVYAHGYDVEFRGALNLRGGGTARFEIPIVPSIGPTAGTRISSGGAAGGGNAARDISADPPPTALPLDHDVPGGHFFSQTAGRDGITGFAVTNEGGVRFWDEFQRLGGVAALGYPVSRRFQSEGFTVQAMQKGVLQWRPEVGRAWLTNVFDEMARAGKDDWLLSKRSTPRLLDPAIDDGKTWAQVLRSRLALLDPQPPIDKRYESAADPLTFFGLPTSRVEDMGNHFAVRLQRAVIQLWKVDVPWAKAGETTVANGGDVAKEAGLFPAEAVAPQRSPLLGSRP